MTPCTCMYFCEPASRTIHSKWSLGNSGCFGILQGISRSCTHVLHMLTDTCSFACLEVETSLKSSCHFSYRAPDPDPAYKSLLVLQGLVVASHFLVHGCFQAARQTLRFSCDKHPKLKGMRDVLSPELRNAKELHSLQNTMSASCRLVLGWSSSDACCKLRSAERETSDASKNVCVEGAGITGNCRETQLKGSCLFSLSTWFPCDHHVAQRFYSHMSRTQMEMTNRVLKNAQFGRFWWCATGNFPVSWRAYRKFSPH